MVTVATAGNWPEDELSLDLVGWKDSACGDLYTSFFSLQNHSSYEGMAVSFLPLLCVFLS